MTDTTLFYLVKERLPYYFERMEVVGHNQAMMDVFKAMHREDLVGVGTCWPDFKVALNTVVAFHNAHKRKNDNPNTR